MELWRELADLHAFKQSLGLLPSFCEIKLRYGIGWDGISKIWLRKEKKRSCVFVQWKESVVFYSSS